MLRIRQTSADDEIKVTFVVPDDVGPASVVGDFNDWDPLAHPMRRRSNGTRSVAVGFQPGAQVRFRYLADGGRWLDEPEAQPAGEDNVIVLPD